MSNTGARGKALPALEMPEASGDIFTQLRRVSRATREGFAVISFLTEKSRVFLKQKSKVILLQNMKGVLTALSLGSFLQITAAFRGMKKGHILVAYGDLLCTFLRS